MNRDERLTQVARMAREGLPTVVIAERLNVSKWTIRIDRRDLGVPAPQPVFPTREATAERRQRVAAMTRQGMSAAIIAEALRTTQRTVCRDRSALGIAGPAPRPLTDEELRTAQALLEDGASYSEVARTLGRADTTIAHRFPGYGWTPTQGAQWALWIRHHAGRAA